MSKTEAVTYKSVTVSYPDSPPVVTIAEVPVEAGDHQNFRLDTENDTVWLTAAQVVALGDAIRREF